MALTNLSQVTSSGIHTLSNYTTHNINSTGIITATSFSGNLSSASGISTFAEIRVTGNLTVEGTTTTLDSVLNEVDRLEIGANTAAVGLAVTQSGTGHVATFEGGNVGINKASPSRYLEIGGTSNNPQIRLSNGSGTSSLEVLGNAASGQEIRFGTEASPQAGRIIYHNNDNSLSYSNTGGEKLRIDSAGRLLLGTETEGSSSADDLTVATSAETGITIRSGTSNPGNIFFSDGESGLSEYRGFITYAHADDSLRFATVNTERLRITSGGNIGIGTVTPLALYRSLGIHGPANDQGGVLDLATKDLSSRGYVFNDSNGLFVQTATNHPIVLRTNNAERLRITSAGDVGIGDNAPNSNYGTNLSVHSTATDGARLKLSDGSTGKGNTDGLDIISTGSIAYFINRENADMSFSTNNTERLRIDSSGNVILGYAGNSLYFQNGFNNRASRIQNGGASGSANLKFYTNNAGTEAERLRIRSDGQIDAKYGVINLGTADSSSGHINAYELMTFNIDSDNDDSNRHFTWYKNAASGAGTGMMRLDENGRLCIGGDLATSGNNLTLKHATDVEIDMHATSGSGNNFRIKSDSSGVFTIRDHSAGADRLTITDAGNIGIGQADPQGDLHIGNISGNKDLIMHSANNGTARLRFREGGSTSSGFNEYSFGMVGNRNAMTVNGQGAGEIMTIMGDTGNVGINDTAPSQKLNVGGNIMLEGGDQYMYLTNVGTGNAGIYVRGNTASSYLRSHSTGMFTWEVTGSEKLRLSSDGKLMTQSAGYIYTASSAGSLSLHGGNTNLGGKIVLSGGNSNGDVRFYAQTGTSSPAQRVVIGATGQVEVSNTVSGNDAAVNIYKSSGDNSDKAILRVGYDAAACFEVYRIRNNGDIFMGANQSGASVRLSTVPTGGSAAERVTILHDGRIGINNTNPPYLFTISEGAYSRITLNQSTTGKNWQMGNDGASLYFFDASTSTRVMDLHSGSSGQLRVYGSIASSAGDTSISNISAGRARIQRLQRGSNSNSRFSGASGYIGDMLSGAGPTMGGVYYMGNLQSSSSSTASSNMLSLYYSGHWGQYTSVRIWMLNHYYNHGYKVWDIRHSSSPDVIIDKGATGQVTVSSSLIGAGTHSGQNVHRVNVTCQNPGTYFDTRWYCGVYFGASVGIFSSAKTESQVDTYLSTRGSGIHFKTLGDAALSPSPQYVTF